MSMLYKRHSIHSSTDISLNNSDNKDLCSGFFVDFIERANVAKERRMARKNTGCQNGETLSATSIQAKSRSIENEPSYTECMFEVHKEKLMAGINEYIMAFWKGLRHPDWRFRGIEQFREHAMTIHKYKHQAIRLKAEVHNWNLRHKLRRRPGRVTYTPETCQERHDRLRDFFGYLHASSSKVDLRAPCSNGRLRLVDSSPKVAQSAFSDAVDLGGMKTRKSVLSCPKSPGSLGFVLDENEGPSLTELSTSAVEQPDGWKLRNAKSRHLDQGWELSRQMSQELDRISHLPSHAASASPSSASPMARTWPFDRRLPTPTAFHRRLEEETVAVTERAQTRAQTSPASLPTASYCVGEVKGSQRPDSTPILPLELQRAERAFKPLTKLIMGRPRSMGTKSASLPNVGSRDVCLEGWPASPQSGGPPPPMERPFMTPWRGCGDRGPAISAGHRFLSVAPSRRSGTKVALELAPVSSGLRPACKTKPSGRYLRETELNCIAPKLIPFVTGHSDQLSAGNQALSDCDLLAMGTMIASRGAIKEADLEGNALLSERSLVPFLRKLSGQPLERLSLKCCMRQALPPGIKETVDVVEELLTDPHGLCRLRALDLTAIKVGQRSQVSLCQAIQNHPCLCEVGLADTGICGSLAKACIFELTSSSTINVLDLSWNSFSNEVFTLLGDRVTQMYSLHSLSIANCSSSQKGLDNPIAYFLESLARDKSLKYLDISVNQITFRGALVLEDALELNSQLYELNISHNPLGVLGIRSTLRLLSRDTSGLQHFDCSGCSGGAIVHEDALVYSAVNPAGRYKLNLKRPYHRALLRMLYKTCDRFGLKPEESFFDITSNTKPPYSHPQKESDGIWPVSRSGVISFSFTIERAVLSSLQGIPDGNFRLFLERYFELVRLKPGMKKLIPLMSEWLNIDNCQSDQVTMLNAINKDFSFTCPQISQFCESRQIIVDVLWRLMPCISGGIPAWFLASRSALTLGDYNKLNRGIRSWVLFNPDNPTGHYKLELENPADFIVAVKLVLVDRWETETNRKKDRFDTSQRGNRSQIRNEKYQSVPLSLWVNSIVDWNMPEFETLELDYVSGQRVSKDSPVFDQETFTGIMLALQQVDTTQVSSLGQVETLRKISHHFYINALQLRQFLGIIGDGTARGELFVTFFLRTVDIQNEKVVRVRFEDPRELQKLRMRLGHATFFPFIQPEQNPFEFDFCDHDQRLACNMLLCLASKERPSNIRDATLTLSDGTNDPLLQGVPRSWEYLERIPKSGVFRCTYICAPEDMKIQERRKLLENYGFWQGPASGTEVMWWAALCEAPIDVIEFLDFLVTRFDDVNDAFVEIDGENGNKNISLREFEDGIQNMKCKKFKGKNQMERIHAVFRYLDPSGEGQVSEGEWGILQLLFNEIQLSIREFVQFLDRTFENDMRAAWDFLDDDGSGEISFDEWAQAVESVGYFGATKPIFSYLDKDDEGTVSYDEFEALASFRAK